MPQFGKYVVWLLHPPDGHTKAEELRFEEYGRKVEGNEVSVWVESEVGKEFDIQWGVRETWDSSRAGVSVNGIDCTSRVHRPEFGIGLHIPLAFQKEDGSFHRYAFAQLPECAEADRASDQAHPWSYDRLGTIRIEIHHVEVIRKNCSDEENVAVTMREAPPALTKAIPVNKVSRQSAPHVIVLGKEQVGRPLPHKKIEYHNICKPLHPEPVAVFTFICRPRDVLLRDHIMPDPALAKTNEGIERCKRRLEEIAVVKTENERLLRSLEGRQKRLKAETSRPALEVPTGSSQECPIDLTEEDFQFDKSKGRSRENPLDLTASH